jgi:hypothetical protein
MTNYTPKDMDQVRLCLGLEYDVSRIADDVPVILGPGVQLSPTVRTVGDLRRLTEWSTKHRLVIERYRHPVIEVRVELL